MIFVVDPDNFVGCGKTVNEALEDYDKVGGNYPIKELKIFQGEEVELEFVLKPKVKKGEFQVDRLAVYCEIDSWIPHAIAPFLTKEGQFPKVYNNVEGQRLRTVKLRGQISQGCCCL